jgi:hypothetical protein
MPVVLQKEHANCCLSIVAAVPGDTSNHISHYPESDSFAVAYGVPVCAYDL